MTRLYYIYPFGVAADDLTSIPNTVPSNGGVNYNTGWTDYYELDLLTNPAALPIPRGQMNQLFYDITNNIQQYQQYGAPFWISSADNGGTPFPYAQWAIASYGGIVYESQVSSNTSTPGTDPNWLQLSANFNGIKPGVIIDYAGYTGVITPGSPIPNLPGYFLCDGSAVSRTTYLNLREAITYSETGTVANTMVTVSGLTSTADMYPGMPVEGIYIQAGTTVATIVDNNNITLSLPATNSGSITLVFFPWGNGDNSTTFNLPDLRRKTTASKFGTGSATLGNKVGQSGGTETVTLLEANLPSTNISANINTTRISNIVQGVSSADADLLVASPSGTPRATTIAFPNGGTAVSVVQPTAIVNKCIKY